MTTSGLIEKEKNIEISIKTCIFVIKFAYTITSIDRDINRRCRKVRNSGYIRRDKEITKIFVFLKSYLLINITSLFEVMFLRTITLVSAFFPILAALLELTFSNGVQFLQRLFFNLINWQNLHRSLLHFKNRLVSQGTMFGKYNGWAKIMALFLPKNYKQRYFTSSITRERVKLGRRPRCS